MQQIQQMQAMSMMAPLNQPVQIPVGQTLPQTGGQMMEEKEEETDVEKYHENPFLRRYDVDDEEVFVKEGGMQIEECGEIDDCPKLALFKFNQEFGVVN